MSYFGNKKGQQPEQSEDEEGEIQSSSIQQNYNEVERVENFNKNNGQQDQIYDSASSEENKDRIEQQMKKRQDFWRAINLSKPQVPESSLNLYESALQAALKTNKKMLILRKKNAKRIEMLQNMRMTQQAPLAGVNTHYRSSINDYPLLTIDESGKKYIHPNSSLRVSECRLDQFIQKNIAEQGTSNYLNEVVKFENYAYQHRKKRRQNFE